MIESKCLNCGAINKLPVVALERVDPVVQSKGYMLKGWRDEQACNLCGAMLDYHDTLARVMGHVSRES